MEGGHDVPITKIIQRFRGSLGNAMTAAGVVDRFYLWDNSGLELLAASTRRCCARAGWWM